MEIKQKFHTFIRDIDEYTYICNSLINRDLIVDFSGQIILSQVSREWKSLDVIVDNLLNVYKDVEKDILMSDVVDFFRELNDLGFIEIRDNNLIGRYASANIDINLPYKDKYLPLVKPVPDSTQMLLLKAFTEHPRLFSLQVELTNLCNERCVHCYIPHKYKARAMSMANFERILEQANEMGVLTFVINGGEPMCHPNFVQMFEKVNSYDFDIKILSNLTQINETIIEKLKNSHVTDIRTSIYSLDPEIHDGITKVKGSLDLTLQNLLRLKTLGLPVSISCVLMKQNKDSYKELLKWANTHKIPLFIDYILFARYDFTSDNLDYRLSKEDIKKIIIDKIENDPSYVEEIRCADFSRLESYFNQFSVSCNVGRSSLCIASDGTAYPCIGWQGYDIGNIEKESLNDIWNSAKLDRLRNISRNDFEECRNCKDKFFCSRCLARNANENNGDYMKLNKFTCELAQLNRTLCHDLIDVDYLGD